MKAAGPFEVDYDRTEQRGMDNGIARTKNGLGIRSLAKLEGISLGSAGSSSGDRLLTVVAQIQRHNEW